VSLSNLEAEAGLIGGLLINNSIIETVSDILLPEDFSLDLHSRMFEVILAENAKGRTISPVGLKPHFVDDGAMKDVGGMAYVARITGDILNGYPDMVIDSAKKLAELAVRRRMQDGLKEAADACGNLDVPTSDIVTHADAAITQDKDDGVHQPTGNGLAELAIQKALAHLA